MWTVQHHQPLFLDSARKTQPFITSVSSFRSKSTITGVAVRAWYLRQGCPIMALIGSYLQNRFILVPDQQYYTSLKKILSDIPQETCVSLILNLFINEILLLNSNLVKLTLNATDTAFYCSRKMLFTIQNLVQNLLGKKIQEFQINPLKSQPVIFQRNRKFLPHIFSQ